MGGVTPKRPFEIDLDLPDSAGGEGRASGSMWQFLQDEEHAVRWISRAAWTVLFLALAVFLVRGADRAVRPKLIPAGAAVPSRAFPGFSEVAFSVSGPNIPADRAKTKHCGLLANTEAQRERGLMNKQTLGGYEGMVFEFPSPTVTPFYMKDTLIPLSLAWFSPTGKWVGSTDMGLCPVGTNCPLFPPPAPYTTAIEVIQSYLSQLGVGPGTVLTVGGQCGA